MLPPTGSRRFFWLAIAVAFGLHWLVLFAPRLSTSPTLLGPNAPVMTVRLLAAKPAVHPESPVAPTRSTVEASPPPAPTPARQAADTRARAAPPAVATPQAQGPGPGPAASPAPSIVDATPPPQAAAPATPVQPKGLPPAPSYLTSGRLDPGPRPLQDIEPVYPTRAGRLQGTVVLRLLINERGIVDEAAVVRSSPPGFFEDAAVEAFSAARFSPGLLAGAPVKSQLTIEVEFTPINRGAGVSGATY